ncbi:MAG TPA: hypothetical protein VGB09_12925, partial [Candidatus Binatia bacterium]
YMKDAEKRSSDATLNEVKGLVYLKKTRFFASLRMTIKAKRFMTHDTSGMLKKRLGMLRDPQHERKIINDFNPLRSS